MPRGCYLRRRGSRSLAKPPMHRIAGAPTSPARLSWRHVPPASPSQGTEKGPLRPPFALRLRLAPGGGGLRKSRPVLGDFGYLAGDASAGPPCAPPERAAA